MISSCRIFFYLLFFRLLFCLGPNACLVSRIEPPFASVVFLCHVVFVRFVVLSSHMSGMVIRPPLETVPVFFVAGRDACDIVIVPAVTVMEPTPNPTLGDFW